MVLRSAVGLLILLLLHSAALAEKRLALLIGNEAYSSGIGRLANPHNDVALLEQTLKGLGFEVVVVRDAGLGALNRAVNAYARRVQAAGPGAVGFFYYSGHGASDGGTNYLIPVDVQTTETGELWDQSLQLTEITGKLKKDAGNATHFVVFDACRNTLKLTQPGSRAVVQSKGFVPVAQENGMLIAYATAEGELASDVGAGAGPYAKVLAEEVVKPGIEAVTMFRNVQRRVRTAIRQEPYLGFSALGDLYLAGKEVKPLEPAPTQARLSEAAEAWAATKDTMSISVLEAFIGRYKDTFFAELARARVDELKKQQMAVAAPLPPSHERCDGVAALVGNEKRCLKPKDIFKDCDTCPEMVVVPAGTFTMGSEENGDEKPVHKVTIAKPFGVAKFEVTFAEWDACVLGNGCKHKPDDRSWGRGSRPVMNVSWDDITKDYLPWLSRKTDKSYRLLTEAEWEYAARAGSRGKYTWGDEIGKNQANCDGCGSQWDNKQTAPVGSFQANAFGLHDMHGNVSEWVADCYKESYANAPSDGRAVADLAGCSHVLRGGAWDFNPRILRAAFRYGYTSVYRVNFLGFRLARTLNP
jgi:formylglycine-generating enzyme required for sulfatase activity